MACATPMGFGLEPGSQRPAEKKRLLDTAIDHRFDGTKKRPNSPATLELVQGRGEGCRDVLGPRLLAVFAPTREGGAGAVPASPSEGGGPQVAESEIRHEEQGDTTIPFNHRAGRAGVQSGVRVGGLPSRLVRKFARRSVRTRRSRSFRTARRRCSFWTARGCRSFSTSERGRPNGRLLRWRRLPDLSQSGGSQAGARPVRSGSRSRAAVAVQRVKCGGGCEHCAAVGPSHALRRLSPPADALQRGRKVRSVCFMRYSGIARGSEIPSGR